MYLQNHIETLKPVLVNYNTTCAAGCTNVSHQYVTLLFVRAVPTVTYFIPKVTIYTAFEMSPLLLLALPPLRPLLLFFVLVKKHYTKK